MALGLDLESVVTDNYYGSIEVENGLLYWQGNKYLSSKLPSPNTWCFFASHGSLVVCNGGFFQTQRMVYGMEVEIA